MNTTNFTTNSSVDLKIFTLLDRYTPADFSSKAKLYYCRYRSRRQLLRLDDARLTDIGLSREQVLAETQLPFWR